MSIKWVPALRCQGDLRTVAAVGDPPDTIGLQQGRDYVQLTESEARQLLEWLGSALPQTGDRNG